MKAFWGGVWTMRVNMGEAASRNRIIVSVAVYICTAVNIQD